VLERRERRERGEETYLFQEEIEEDVRLRVLEGQVEDVESLLVGHLQVGLEGQHFFQKLEGLVGGREEGEHGGRVAI
jgi:hypothetical protein